MLHEIGVAFRPGELRDILRFSLGKDLLPEESAEGGPQDHRCGFRRSVHQFPEDIAR
jgi:hypothetical protein